jgi:hypothetical protein
MPLLGRKGKLTDPSPMTTLSHPYTNLDNGTWLRGNLHAHTTRSDGHMTMQQVIDAYAELSYDFLMISDHNVYTSPDDYAACDARGLVLIPGNEVSDVGPDILHVNADRLIESIIPRQHVLNTIANGPGFAVACHPNVRFNHCTIEQLMEWVGYVGIEVLNGSSRHTYGHHLATDKWDMLLAAGRKAWGFANDDSHEDWQIGLGWNMVYAPKHTADAILDAMRAGRFYMSSGVTICEIHVDGSRIEIKTDNAQRIAAIRELGVRCATSDSTDIAFDYPATAPYVRFECWGPGEQMAWTQPFFNPNAPARIKGV